MSDHIISTDANILSMIAPSPEGVKLIEKIGVCSKCHTLDLGTCPILDRAYGNGYEGMEHCEMKAVIDRVFQAGKAFEKMGGKAACH